MPISAAPWAETSAQPHLRAVSCELRAGGKGHTPPGTAHKGPRPPACLGRLTGALVEKPALGEGTMLPREGRSEVHGGANPDPVPRTPHTVCARPTSHDTPGELQGIFRS